jgi:excisionase family DNA binding protein
VAPPWAPAPETISLREAASRLNIRLDVAYKLVATDRFPTSIIRAGRRILVPRAELDRALGLPAPASVTYDFEADPEFRAHCATLARVAARIMQREARGETPRKNV